MKKAVLWDLDGTILDSLTIMHDVVYEIFPKLGLEPVDRESIRSEFHGPYAESVARISKNYKDQDELVSLMFESQLKHHENPVTHEGIHEAIAHFADKGYKQTIVTSRHGGDDLAGAHRLVKTLKLELHIETVISASETVNHKPHPEPVLKALRILDVVPENAVMIGDQAVDVEAARSAGVRSILIDHEYTKESREAAEAAHADLLCSNASEVIDGVHRMLGV